jgi:hypothetical protein
VVEVRPTGTVSFLFTDVERSTHLDPAQESSGGKEP